VLRFWDPDPTVPHKLCRTKHREQRCQTGYPEENLRNRSHSPDIIFKKCAAFVTANLLCSLVLTQKPHKANSYIDISQLLAAASKIKAASSVIWVINHIGNWELFILAPR
jgi:hypothetical protein